MKISSVKYEDYIEIFFSPPDVGVTVLVRLRSLYFKLNVIRLTLANSNVLLLCNNYLSFLNFVSHSKNTFDVFRRRGPPSYQLLYCHVPLSQNKVYCVSKATVVWDTRYILYSSVTRSRIIKVIPVKNTISFILSLADK